MACGVRHVEFCSLLRSENRRLCGWASQFYHMVRQANEVEEYYMDMHDYSFATVYKTTMDCAFLQSHNLKQDSRKENLDRRE